MLAERLLRRRRTLIPSRHWLLYVALFQMVAWVFLLGSSREWVGSWKMAYDWVAGSLIMVGPMSAGVAAVGYARIRGSSAFDLIRSGARLSGWAFPLLKIWAAVLASTALLGLEVTGYVVARGVPVFPAQLVNLPYLLALSLAHVSLGALIGLHLREVWAGVAAVTTSFLLFLLAAAGPFPPVFMSGGTTGTLVGEVYRRAALALLFVSAAGLAVVLIALLAQRFGAGRWATGGLVVVGVAAFLVGFAPRLDLEGRLQFTEVDYVCRGSQPALCMARETPLLTDEGAAALKRLSAPLVEAGVELPSRWRQELPGEVGPGAAGSFSVSDGSESTGELRQADVVDSLTTPGACARWEFEPARSTNARDVLSDWIAERNGLRSGYYRGAEFKDWVHSARSEAWVRSTYRNLRDCRLHAIAPPRR